MLVLDNSFDVIGYYDLIRVRCGISRQLDFRTKAVAPFDGPGILNVNATNRTVDVNRNQQNYFVLVPHKMVLTD